MYLLIPTLTVPTLDFDAMRRELGIAAGDIAAEILKLPPDKQTLAWNVVERHERAALQRLRLQDGCQELLAACRAAGIRLGLVTRNALFSVQELCRRFDLDFDTVVTREFRPLKPHPAPVLSILSEWRVNPRAVLVVGDYIHDLECGRTAGAVTCFFHNAGFPDWSASADFTVKSMAELARLIFDRPPFDHPGESEAPVTSLH